VLSLSSLFACSDKPTDAATLKQAALETVAFKINENETVPKEDANMLIRLENFSFTVPASWRDTTSYHYKSAQQNLAFTVSFGRTNQTILLEQYVDQRRQELTDTMGNEVEFSPQTATEIASMPAIIQAFHFGERDQSQRYSEYWLTAFYAENQYFTLSYVGPKEDKTLKDTFEHIVTSSQISSNAKRIEVKNGFVIRQANILSLQLPEQLQPPKHYTFVSPDSGLKLKVSLYPLEENWPDDSLEVNVAKDMRFGGKAESMSKELHQKIEIRKVAYTFQGGDPLEPTIFRGQRAEVTASEFRILLFVKGEGSQAAQLDSFWQQFISDFIENN
jgi:hypothetical protein